MKKNKETSPNKVKTRKYWSKRKRYGWGWTPTTWQGWTVVGTWLGFVVAISLFLLGDSDGSNEDVNAYIFLSLVFLSTVPLILISYATGPKPKWRWGKSDDDNPDEDW